MTTPPTGTYLAGIGAGILVLAGLILLALSKGTAAPLPYALAAGLSVAGALWCLYRLRKVLRAAGRLALDSGAEAGRMRAMVGAMPDPWFAWEVGSDGRVDAHASSDRFAAMLGLARVDSLDRVEQALAPSDAAALHGVVAHLRETGQPFQITVRLADGSRTFQASGGRGPLPGGGALDVLWLRDATPQAAEQLRLAEARAAAERERRHLLDSLEALALPVWQRGRDLRVTWCNRAFARLLDTTPERVVAEQMELPTSGFGEPARGLALLARERGAAITENRFVVVEGDRRLLELTEMPVTGDGFFGFAVDRTRERAFADELDRHIGAHAEVLEQLGSAIAIYGPDTRLKFHNQAYARLWGLEETWLRTEPPYGEVLEDLRLRRKLTEEADFPRWKRQQLGQFNSLIEPREDLVHLPDGRTLRSLSVPHPFGGLMFVMEDVTHTLALESSYNTLMAVQQETLDNLAEGVAVFGGDGRLKLSNPAFARLWRLGAEVLRGEPHAAEVVEAVRGLLFAGGDWREQKGELVGRLLDRAGATGHIHCTDGTVVRYTQVPLPDGAVLLSCLDITDSVRVEKALRASNEALETADRLKSEFIANVSYQLRTPLNAIMGFAEILHNQYFGELNVRQVEYARGVLEASRRLLALVNDILDLATIEAGFMVLERDQVDVAQLLHGVAGLTRDWARKQSLDLRVDVPEGIGSLSGDEKRLKQALFNLVSNAIKFTPAGGRITLSAARTPDAVTLSVSDTGIGIPQGDRQRVFGRFERGDNRPANGAGAGLGLSLVKSFIELHGGSVTMESAHGTGTTVRCRLPLDPHGGGGVEPAVTGEATR